MLRRVASVAARTIAATSARTARAYQPTRAAATDISFGGFSSGPLSGKDVLSGGQFNKDAVEYVFSVAENMQIMAERFGACDLLKGKILANCFYEPSTRTASSFHTAMLRLGGGVIPLNSLTSSQVKGETLADSVRVMENYADVIVIRHPEIGAAAVAAKYATIPVINSGDGAGEHPTQALLDMYAIRSERGKNIFDRGCHFVMVGDLKYGRTVHSLAQTLALFPKVKITMVSPEALRMPTQYVEIARRAGVEVVETTGLDRSLLATTDVLYVTRVQKERFATEADYKKVKGSYIIDSQAMATLKKDAVLLHPLPRVDEVTEDVDTDPRSVYFRQPKYGLFVRMALLAGVLGKV